MDTVKRLYLESWTLVFSYLRKLGADSETAEELVQETFLQVILSLGGFRGESAPSTWLLGIARRVFLKDLRAKRRRLPQYRQETLMAAALTPAALLDRSEDRAWLWRLINELPEPYYSVLILHHFCGLTYAEVGMEMGRLEVWARVTCHRAREKVRQLALEDGREGDRRGR